MQYGASRTLTASERTALSGGLAAAMSQDGVVPLIVARPALGARIAALWRGSVPIMVLRARIYWPGAVADFAGDTSAMALLQHELQHVLEFASGELKPLSYVLNPRNWGYAYKVEAAARWSDFGAEQRAQIVEDLWRGEHGQSPHRERLAWFRGVVPWAIACG